MRCSHTISGAYERRRSEGACISACNTRGCHQNPNSIGQTPISITRADVSAAALTSIQNVFLQAIIHIVRRGRSSAVPAWSTTTRVSNSSTDKRRCCSNAATTSSDHQPSPFRQQGQSFHRYPIIATFIAFCFGGIIPLISTITRLFHIMLALF